MEFCEIIEEHPSRRTVYTIYPLADLHIGLVGLDEELLRKDVAKIKRSPNARWISMGEMCDLIVPGDKRWDPAHMAPWVDQLDVAESQVKRALEIFEPIADKCWGMMLDTHTDSMRKHINRDIYSELLRRLGEKLEDCPEELKENRLKRFESMAFLNVTFRRDVKSAKGNSMPSSTFHFWLHHGWFAGRLAGHVALNLQRLTMNYDADIYCVAHGHKKHILPLSYLSARHATDHGERPMKMPRFTMMCGTYVDAHKANATSWAEKRGYYPTPLGCPVIRIKPDTRKVEVSDSGELPTF